MTDAAANRPLRIFLCHASNDKPAVRDLYRRLTADGFAPWLDEEDLLPGQKWRDEIPKAVRESDVVLVCLSQHSINKAGYVQKEIKSALDLADEQPDGAIFLIPLRLEECNVPERLNHLQWVNFYDDGGYARLLRALRRRAADLSASTAAASVKPVSHATPEARRMSVNNVSGGVTLENIGDANIGGDVTGRDKIIQAGTYIEHATIIQSAPQTPEYRIATPSEYTIFVRKFGDMEFVRVPVGKFLMGSKDDNNMAVRGECPQHTVDVPYDYWIGKFPVTNEQFSRFVAVAKYKFDQGEWQRKANHPVVDVSWRDALAYCKWLNDTLRGALKDLTVRLPTEAEWEKAARGEYGNEWPWGDEFDKNKCNSIEGIKGGTTPVGVYSPHGDSPYGAADMAGNVWEWCRSKVRPYPYQADDGRESETSSNFRVVRGGSWSDGGLYARCSCRSWCVPDSRKYSLGLRCVLQFS